MAPKKRKGAREKTVLVAVLKNRRDLAILSRGRWYRVPVSHLPARPFTYLAFYQPAAFGPEGKRIRFYARVLGWRARKRLALLPDEPHHRNAQAPYAQVRIGALRLLPRPIVNTSPRRVSFGFTTLARLRKARNILELYGVPDTEWMMRAHLRRAGVRAVAQAHFSDGVKRCRLDFAVYCARGSIAIECDNKKAHAGKRQRARDEARDAFLKRRGWIVFRFTGEEIVARGKECAAKIAAAVRRLGGQDALEMRQR